MLLFTSIPKTEEATPAELDLLLQEIAAGNRAALEALYRHTRPAVYGFALSILKNAHDAEDVLHDCYVAVWQAAGYRTQGKPMAWLMTITRNLCLQLLRQRQKTADLPEEDWYWPPAWSDYPMRSDRLWRYTPFPGLNIGRLPHCCSCRCPPSFPNTDVR